MAEKETTKVDASSVEQPTELPTTEENYLETIRQLKSTTVGRDKYDKAIADNKKLLESIINGEEIALSEKKPVEEKADVNQLRKELYSSGESQMNDLEYVKKTLALREAIIEKGMPDPFLPVGRGINSSIDDVEKAKQTAKVLQECVDEADGDSEQFRLVLASRIAPDSSWK